jgi:hypothetical protein
MKRFGVSAVFLAVTLVYLGVFPAGATINSPTGFRSLCASSASANTKHCMSPTNALRFHTTKNKIPKVGTTFINWTTGSAADNFDYGGTSLWVASTGEGYVIYDATDGFQVAPTITTFSDSGKKLATISPSLSYSQFSVLSHPPTGGIIIALDQKSQPAQGLTPASQSFTFTAWSANSGKKMWTTPRIPGQGENEFVETSNGLYATADLYNQNASIVNLSTGAIRNSKILDEPSREGAIGNFIDVETCIENPVGGEDLQRLINPATGAVVSTFQAGIAFGCEVGQSQPARVPPRTLNIGNSNLVLNGNLGNAGLFQNTSYGAQSGISPDGSKLFISGGTKYGDCCIISAYSLPTMKRIWSRTEILKMEGDDGGVLVGLQTNAKTNSVSFVGINDHSGSTIWKQPTTSDSGELQVCAITTTQTLIVANYQLIGLNLQTGHQNWYEKNDNVTCGNMLTGGAAYYFNTDVAVEQFLTP